MHATGEPPRVTDITGFIMLVYSDNGAPVLLRLPGDTISPALLPVFSTREKLLAADAWMGLQSETKPQRIIDAREFVSQFDLERVIVAADPYVVDGKTRWTAIVLQ